MKLSLRAKGLAVFAVLIAYVGVTGVTLGRQRAELLQTALSLEQVYADEAALGKASAALSRATLRVEGHLYSSDLPESFDEDIGLDVELVQAGFTALRQSVPSIDDARRRIDSELDHLRTTRSHAALLALRDAHLDADRMLAAAGRTLNERHGALWRDYHTINDRMTLLAVTMNLFGAVIFGALVTMFFTRLAWDIRKLEFRARAIVEGYRGPPLEVTRSDEIGTMMGAVNEMQTELRAREQQIELSREQRFHQEKMAAVGSLAAAVAHEISNPIAAIAGVARSLRDGRGVGTGGATESIARAAEMIIEQTQRISGISRQIAEYTRPRSPSPGLIDLNALARSTSAFVGYDPRLRGVEIVLELDPAVPAIHAVEDHVAQVLMNLVINAADALESVADRTRRILVRTRVESDQVILEVEDNGVGMDADVLARAFEDSFSTKPADRGRGLGLFLCKSLMDGIGAGISLESVPGEGTRAIVRMPRRSTKHR